MSVRPISRVAGASTHALRGAHGVGGADAAARIMANVQAASSSVGSSGVHGGSQTTGVSFAATLQAVSGSTFAVEGGGAVADDGRALECARKLAAEKDGEIERTVEDLRERVEAALDTGDVVNVGEGNRFRPRSRTDIRALLTDGTDPPDAGTGLSATPAEAEIHDVMGEVVPPGDS